MSTVNPRNQKPPVKKLLSVRDELSLMGLMHALANTPAGPGASRDGGTSELFATEGFGVVVIPPALFGHWELAIRSHLLVLVTTLRPPRTAMEAACYGVLGEMAERGKRASPDAVVLGLALAAAKAQGVRIQTHPRDLAKEAKVRYGTLLLVQRLALKQFRSWGLFAFERDQDKK